MSSLNSTSVVNSREHRAAQIASAFDFRKRGDAWIVPSQSGKGTYRVRLGKPHPTCTCPDHALRRVKCKHIRAVEISLRREERPDGTAVVTKAARPTYRQNWPAYNKAQTHETERFAELLHGLCRGIVQPKQTRGRPRLPLSDVVFGATFKGLFHCLGPACHQRPQSLAGEGLHDPRSALQQRVQLSG